MQDKFGLTVIKKSFRELGAAAQAISDEDADQTWAQRKLPTDGLSPRAVRSAVKIYLAVRATWMRIRSIRAAGINCLNESHFSDTTPCLAWNMLYQERRLIWGCEADTLSMITKYILHKSLDAPIMMTNLYPFLLGNAALKHERIESFPDVEAEPENHVLVAHCGYMGVIPTSFATEWTLRKKVLAIVDDNASAIDARLPIGDVTLAKLHPTMDKLTVAEGQLTGYAHFAGLRLPQRRRDQGPRRSQVHAAPWPRTIICCWSGTISWTSSSWARCSVCASRRSEHESRHRQLLLPPLLRRDLSGPAGSRRALDVPGFRAAGRRARRGRRVAGVVFLREPGTGLPGRDQGGARRERPGARAGLGTSRRSGGRPQRDSLARDECADPQGSASWAPTSCGSWPRR